MLRRWMAAGLVAVATAGVLNAVPATAQRPYDPTAQSLRALGQRHGLYVGTAVDMAALADPADPRTARSSRREFSTVTAENVMKWESLEPTRGTYNWAAGRRTGRLRPAATASRSAATCWSGTTSCPTWLTDGVADGTISNAELRQILREAHHRRGHATSRARSGSGTWSTRRSATRGTPRPPCTTRASGPQHLGPGYIADAFRWARAADPKALLFYNDYNIEAFGSATRPTTRRSSSTTWSRACGPRACRSTASAARATWAPSTATTTPSRSPTRSALRRAGAGHGVHRGGRAQPDDRRGAGRRLQRDQPAAAGVRGELQRAAAGLPVRTGTACRSPSGASPTSTPGCPARSTTRRRAWPPSTTRTTSRSGRTSVMKADLIYAGPPYVRTRATPKPRR